jgi:vacuolar-type H+-ATPase subunit I/STV1
MRYLREARALELLDVKDMVKGYEGTVSPCETADRLYRISALSSKIMNLSAVLRSGARQVVPVQVAASLSDVEISEMEAKIASIEREVNSLSSESQVCDRITDFAESEFPSSVDRIMKITDVNAPDGRNGLEEIMSKIMDGLPPPVFDQAQALDEARRKDIVESLRRAIVERVAETLAARKGEAAVLQVLSEALDLKIVPGSHGRRIRFEPRSRVEETRRRAAELSEKLHELGVRNAEWLHICAEQVNAERVLEEAKGLCGRTESTYVVEGWLPTNRIPQLQAELNNVTGGHCVVQEWTRKGSPTILRNPRWVGLFQRLTMGFGTPDSTEIDPSALWFVTYPLFFGLMYGDVGHGLLFVALTGLIWLAKRRGTRFTEESFAGLGGLFNMILDGSGLLVLGGAAATLCGFLYGTVMGSEEWFRELTGLAGPLWFDPFKEPMKLLKVSIIIGILHVSSGLILSIVNKVRNREFDELLAGPGLWLWFYLTLGYLILEHGFRLISYTLSNIAIILLLLGLPSGLMLIARVRVKGTLEGFGEWMESMLASISHTISYIRIMAMKMIHDVFSQLFLGILFAVPLYVGVPIFSMLTIVMIVILEGAFVFLQDLRLHWVEWFLKFYSGSGISFRPFGIRRTYTSISAATG